MADRRFYTRHPHCCFCGGGAPAKTIDHVPPKACFRNKITSEDFEFPACATCNSSSKQHDQAFSLYVRLTDFEPSHFQASFTRQLYRGVANNAPGLLPRLNCSARESRNALRDAEAKLPRGMFLRDYLLIPDNFYNGTIPVIGKKMLCAFYYRETGRVLPLGTMLGVWNFHGQGENAGEALAVITSILPNHVIAQRRNVDMGRQFGYRSGLADGGEVFAFVAQFGAGIVIGGVAGPRRFAETSVEKVRWFEHTPEPPTVNCPAA